MENQTNKELHNQDDVNPGSELGKIVTKEESDTTVKTDGTGGNRPVQTEGTVVIKEEDED